eukprot:1087202-Prymnesium_polylepis.1
MRREGGSTERRGWEWLQQQRSRSATTPTQVSTPSTAHKHSARAHAHTPAAPMHGNVLSGARSVFEEEEEEEGEEEGEEEACLCVALECVCVTGLLGGGREQGTRAGTRKRRT